MDRQIILNDRVKLNDDNMIKGTRVIARIPGTDTILWETHNKVLAAGSAFVASQHFDFGQNAQPAPVTGSYNQALKLDQSLSDLTTPTTPKRICLFCVGTDGCGETSAQQYEVDYTKWLKPEDMVPFRYTNKDLTDIERETYFGKAIDENNTGFSKYYFKTFDLDPLWIQRRIDGSPINESLYNDDVSQSPLQSYVELKLIISPSDCREWFDYTGNRNGYINTICLLQGWYTEVGIYKYYQNVHPVTKLNFPTEYLIDPTKGLDITYDIFY